MHDRFILNIVRMPEAIFIIIALGILSAFLLIRYAFFFAKVVNYSMFPTLKPGLTVFCTRVYSEKSIKRGDVVIVNSVQLKHRIIKRVIGLAGDRVLIDRSGQVSVNGLRIDESYVQNPGPPSGEFFVPDNHLFLMGDNRKQSGDSRTWEVPYVSFDQIIAKAQLPKQRQRHRLGLS